MPGITLKKYTGSFTTLDNDVLLINEVTALSLQDAIHLSCQIAEEDEGKPFTYKDIIDVETETEHFFITTKCALQIIRELQIQVDEAMEKAMEKADALFPDK